MANEDYGEINKTRQDLLDAIMDGDCAGGISQDTVFETLTSPAADPNGACQPTTSGVRIIVAFTYAVTTHHRGGKFV